jgi:small-conductance mechanosensitive channel
MEPLSTPGTIGFETAVLASAVLRYQSPRSTVRVPLATVAVTGFSLLLCLSRSASAGSEQEPGSATTPTALTRLSEPAADDQAAPVVFGNRTITVLRAKVIGHLPEDRAAAAVRRLDDLVARHEAGAVRRRFVEGAVILRVGDADVFAIVPADVDELAGETLDGKSSDAETHLGRALEEVTEARLPRLMLRNAAAALAATAAILLVLWLVWRLQERAAAWLTGKTAPLLQRQLQGHEQIENELRALQLGRQVVRFTALVLSLLLGYSWLGWVLERFPYTRPWGEALGGFLVSRVLLLVGGLVGAVPGLVTVALIFVLTRAVVRLAGALFDSIETGRVTVPGLYPDTAAPTRRLVTALLWVLAMVASYPYLPGSQTDAFKGVSVLLGLMISLGSTSLINQVMSSFVITYSRSLRVGDWARVGDVEGLVLKLGMLSTKVRTIRNEEVTLPNAVVTSTTATNFSRLAGDGLYTNASVTIGYDTPWRQVEALLLEAAEVTPGLRAEPRPFVLQTALHDFYVEYRLYVSVDKPERYPFVLNDLHARIQDAFNTYGVQIMSPNYRGDPAAPKVVAKERWFAAPARDRGDGPPSSNEA